ncbi:hypothetical protein LE181_02280 [Streptomyces sp. SCA3-4]|uniref:hypothetical protein n=1 Tax=Streptomyces sichuanensis TaxID=2871810 RepID=UPI001CE2EC3E|nr:hypothetical protein [Streptomyces sichuanensis]MCA6091001.1 hypothetical protein [Streptomyces sichuanensis]
MRWRAVVAICALVVATSVTSTGCACYFECGTEGDRPAGLTNQDMVGTYKADPFATVTLRGDGTFSASDWPEFNYPNKPKHTGGATLAAITHSHTPFEQYHALRLAAQRVDLLDADQARRLAEAVEAQNFGPDGERELLGEDILRKVRGRSQKR